MTIFLDLMLDSNAFMVSGLFVPVMGALFWSRSRLADAMSVMIIGGCTRLSLRYLLIELPYGLDSILFGITASAIAFITVSLLTEKKRE